MSGDLTVTAQYTSATWAWGGVAGAELLATDHARFVFRVANTVLGCARLLQPGQPSLRHSLLHRHAMLDRLVGEEGAPAVLELAAGLSARGLRVSADPAVRYVEVDLPAVVAQKRELLARTSPGQAVLCRGNFELAAGNALDLDLAEVAPAGARLTVVAEGLLVYLDRETQGELWRRVAELLAERGGVLLFDLVPGAEEPRGGLPGAVMEQMMKVATGGRAFARDDRDRAAVEGDLRAAGFGAVEAYDAFAVAREWGLPYPGARTKTVVWRCRAGGCVA